MPNDWLTLPYIATIGGAMMAVVLLIQGIKFLFPSVNGTVTNIVTFVFSELLVFVVQHPTTGQLVLLCFINGVLLFLLSWFSYAAISSKLRRGG